MEGKKRVGSEGVSPRTCLGTSKEFEEGLPSTPTSETTLECRWRGLDPPSTLGLSASVTTLHLRDDFGKGVWLLSQTTTLIPQHVVLRPPPVRGDPVSLTSVTIRVSSVSVRLSSKY